MNFLLTLLPFLGISESAQNKLSLGANLLKFVHSNMGPKRRLDAGNSNKKIISFGNSCFLRSQSHWFMSECVYVYCSFMYVCEFVFARVFSYC